MIGRLTALILLCTVYLIQTAELPHQISTEVVEVGGNVTLHCSFSEGDGQSVYWYKQSLGYLAQTVFSVVVGRITPSEQFNNPRFTATKESTQCSLTIRNVSKEDEATYFCQKGKSYSQSFVNGTFLAVNDRNQQKSFYVKQSPETESVKPGDSVTLQCSLLSKNKEVQCPGEQDVHWFRSGSREYHPGIIYTHSDKEEEKRCVYSLSKTIQNSSDTGTYYCAVVTCGEILFGEGTKVETRNDCDSGSVLDPVVLVLGVLLACCAIVIVVLIFYGNRRKVCEHCKAPVSASHHLGHNRSTVDLSNDLDGGLNYAALDFSTRKVKRGKRKTRKSPQECLYSAVRANNHNQQHTSL
ncbi:immunoglobulin lambda-1 light chain-like [Sebastes umbrosus]|uniref:immunoglobulin lambda-1 light chain-like n=1 Tax=Sebastes umbrosus TaxID=72105 RepID=UPI00189FEA3B|nr:immunoglobulin lambda-1 light chain-like [Sebastes umbrosus]